MLLDRELRILLFSALTHWLKYKVEQQVVKEKQLTKQSVPYNESTSVILVNTVGVSAMVDPMMTWCVEDIFQRTQTFYILKRWIKRMLMLFLSRYWNDHYSDYGVLKKTHYYLSRLVTKPTKWVCAQRRLGSAWASAQSDQSLRCALNG